MEVHQRQCKEMQIAGMIWWLILWYASEEGKREVPAEQQWLSCELIAAIVESARNVPMHYSWRYDHKGNECAHQWDEWPPEVNRMMQLVPRRGCSSTERELQKLMKRFVMYRFTHGHGEKDYSSELAYLHDTSTPRPVGRSRFVPGREMYEKANAVLCEASDMYPPAFWCATPEWIRMIAERMRTYIDRDIAYIKKHYSW